MILQTPRLTLRPAAQTDLAALHDVFSAPAAMRYWSHPAHTSVAQTQLALDALIATPTEFCVIYKGSVVGKAGAWRQWEVGFILHPSVWGFGLATEALTAVIAHLFDQHRAPSLTAEVDPRNVACLALLSRLGFLESHRASRTMQWGDEWCDSIYLKLEASRICP